MNKNIIIGCLLFTAFISCNKKPKACFTFSQTSNVKIDDTITLVNCSENYTQSQWTLPNNAITTANSPRIRMSDSGTYNVTLKVGTDNFKNSNTITKSINILPK